MPVVDNPSACVVLPEIDRPLGDIRATFRAQGYVGCHPDVHYGELGSDCSKCHDETFWHVPNARVAHVHTRFPLTGAHMQVACHRRHAGARVNNFRPTDPDCVSCRYADAAETTIRRTWGWAGPSCRATAATCRPTGGRRSCDERSRRWFTARVPNRDARLFG